MKSRFWNTWTKEEPKVRSPMILKERTDESKKGLYDKQLEMNSRSRKNRGLHRGDLKYLSPNRGDKSRINEQNERNNFNNDYDEDDDDEDGGDNNRGGDLIYIKRRNNNNNNNNDDNVKSNWRRENNKISQDELKSLCSKSKGSGMSDYHDKCIEVKLTNGKLKKESRTNNGFIKQVKRSDESLQSVDREDRGGVNFYDDNNKQQHQQQDSFHDYIVDEICQPIKFVRKAEEFQYKHLTNDNDIKSNRKLISNRTKERNKKLLTKDINPELKINRSDFYYSDKSRFNRYSNGNDDDDDDDDDDDYGNGEGGDEVEEEEDDDADGGDDDESPDRDVEPLKESNGRLFSNGNKKCRDEFYKKKMIYNDHSDEEVAHNEYAKNYRVESRRVGANLVRISRENSFNGSSSTSRRKTSDYKKTKNNTTSDDKKYYKTSSSSSSLLKDKPKRESSRERQLFRKISFKLKSKISPKNQSPNQEKQDVGQNYSRHSRPLTPPIQHGKNNYDEEKSPIIKHHHHQSDNNKYQSRKKLSSNYVNSHQESSWLEKEWYSSEESPEREKKKFPSDKDDNDPGFSTIERNGTTVIRIRSTSDSPVEFNEKRYQYKSVSSKQFSKYNKKLTEEDKEDDDDDDDDDDIDDDENDGDMDDDLDYFDRKRRLTSDSFHSWNHDDSSVLITDLEDGQPCLQCGLTCSGFSPHIWRKNCTSCKCPKEAHDVCHEEWVSVRARLGLKGEGPNNYIGFEPRERGLAWAPPGLPPHKVEEYFSMLPEISVPRLGTPGERHRDRQLATQLPKQDLARAYCRHLDPEHSTSADDFMAARNEIALDIGSVQEVLERGHECGVCHEPLKYGSLAVMASKLGLLYHPSCFQCTHCKELLVDLAYCIHEDSLYCERHYAERLKPRCAACDELIFSGEYTKAMNKDWHSGHFCCWQCDESLTGQRYVLRDEHPYCIKCYESVFANGCEECNKIIGIDSKDLSYKDKHWHEACFLCNKCRVSLVDKQFGSKVDKIYCGNCYDAQFASRCDGCGEIFRAGTKKMEYKTRQWHEKCFCCVVCKNPIGTKSFIPREQEIYCAGCYEDKFATRCVKCNKIITSGGVTYKNEPWHRDCFTCSHCNQSLAGQRFTSRDDKPYCAECFGELFAKRCTACSKPITGIGGTRFISFEDRHWHNDCFICAGCNTSLVGRGFITDADDIICPECAKQKLSE